MLAIFTKKKISELKVSNIFVNSLLDVTEKGWEDIAAMIDEDPSFMQNPNLRFARSDKFIMIIFAANLKYMSKYFDKEQEDRLRFKIVEKLSVAFGMEEEKLYKYVKEYSAFLSKVNHPSNNILYSISKGIYHKYNLNEYQEEYFRSLKTPNPLLLKRMDEVLVNFIWDWDEFLSKYKISA